MADPSVPFEKESPRLKEIPSPLFTPRDAQEFTRVSRARKNEVPLSRDDIFSGVKDFLSSRTLNGYPIDFEGNNIRISAEAMTVQRATAQTLAQQASFAPSPFSVAPPVQLPRPIIPVPPAATSTEVTSLPAPVLIPVDNFSGHKIEPERPNLSTPTNFVPTKKQEHQNAILRDPKAHQEDVTMFQHGLINVKLTRGDKAVTICGVFDATTGGAFDPGADPASYYTAGGNIVRYAFACSDASDMDGAKVLILDGDINGDLPDGMGGDDYTVTVGDGDEIYAVITYDTDTFDVTSRSIGVGSTPANEYGTIYVLIAICAVYSPGGGAVPVVTVTNRHCGDINLSIRFTILDGVLYAEGFSTFGDPAVVPDM